MQLTLCHLLGNFIWAEMSICWHRCCFSKEILLSTAVWVFVWKWELTWLSALDIFSLSSIFACWASNCPKLALLRQMKLCSLWITYCWAGDTKGKICFIIQFDLEGSCFRSIFGDVSSFVLGLCESPQQKPVHALFFIQSYHASPAVVLRPPLLGPLT